MKRLLLLANSKASSGQTPLEDALGVIRDTGLRVDVHRPSSVAQMQEMIREHQAVVDAVVIGGGDGSINAALPAVLEAGLPLGVLPLGTANDFARTLALPADLHGACGVIAAQAIRRVDVGWANDRPFVNAAGIGLSTRVARELSRDRKQRLGPLSYPAAVLDVIRQYRPFHAHIESPAGIRELESVQITVGNGVYYGGGNPVAEDCAIDDGRLDLYSVRPRPLGRLMAVAWALRQGSHARLREDVLTAGAATFHISTRPVMAVSLDGEPCLETPVSFRVAPGALAVLAPPPETLP